MHLAVHGICLSQFQLFRAASSLLINFQQIFLMQWMTQQLLSINIKLCSLIKVTFLKVRTIHISSVVDGNGRQILCSYMYSKCLCKLYIVSSLNYSILKFNSSTEVFLKTFGDFILLPLGELLICFPILFSLNRLNYFVSLHFIDLHTFVSS